MSITGSPSVISHGLLIGLGMLLAVADFRPAWADGYAKGLDAHMRGDYAAAFRIWEPLAEQGDAGSENGLGVLYETGEGVAMNIPEAMKWFGRAAAQGFTKAEYNLGMMYAQGALDVPPDLPKAILLLKTAADQGFTPAQSKVGELYYETGKSQSDYARAFHYLGQAVHARSAQAADDIGWLYEEGLGVPKDKSMAYAWFRIAASQSGDAKSSIFVADLETLRRVMSPEEISDAEKRAKECIAADYVGCGLDPSGPE